MKTLNLQDRLLVARAGATFARLSLLDDIWTSYLEKAVNVPKRDVAPLGLLTSEMRSLLDDARLQARLLKRPIAKLEIDWDQRFTSVMKSVRLSRDMTKKVLALVERDGGVRARTLKALAEVVKKASDDQKELKRKMQIISKGGYVPGDLRLACVIDAAGMGCGLAAGGLGGAALFVFSFGQSVRNHCWG
jgi:hypothetical protein